MAIANFCAHCGAENQPSATHCHACQHHLDSPVPLQTYDPLLHTRYQLLSQVGSGGFGAVYQARDTQHNERLVAVKQINLAGLSSQEIIEATDAFNREAQILSTLSHPLLPQIFDRFSDTQHWYLVMTLIQGLTLDEYLQQQQAKALPAHAGLPLEETLNIALRLCDALSYLHSQQPSVIFRDLKPGNIMRTPHGQLYLIDFGIARRFKPGQAKDTIPFGSPGFAAPEQYGKAQTTPQADLYSLGALLYCLLSGDDPSEHPFQFPSLHPCNTASLRGVNELIQRLVALDPAQRPADIQVVQRELERIQDLHNQDQQHIHIWTPPQGQTPPSFPTVGSNQIALNQFAQQPTKRKTKRRTLLVASLVIGGLVTTGEVINALMGSSQPVPLSTTDQSMGEPHDPTATATNQIPAVPVNGPTYWSPDLSHAAVANLRKNQIEIYKVLNHSFVQNMHLQTIKLQTSFSNITLQWSANNSNIAAQADNGMIYSWDAKTGQQLFTFADAMAGYEPNSVALLSWSPTGQYCAIGYAVDSIHDTNGNPLHMSLTIIQTSNGESSSQMSFPAYNTGNSSILAWSPDSRYLAFPDAPSWAENTLWKANIWDREKNQIIQSVDGLLPSTLFQDSISAIAWSSEGEQLVTVINGQFWINRLGRNQPSIPLANISGNGFSYGPLWSPDEKYLAIITNENILSVYATSNGDVAYLSTNGWQDSWYGASLPHNLASFAWSADSKSITVADYGNVLTNWPLR